MSVWFGVVSLFPEMFKALTHYGVVRRAFDQNKLALDIWNPRDFTVDKHRTVDDRPFGGGPGMLMKAEPLRKAIQFAKQESGCDHVIYLSPQGRKLDNKAAFELSKRKKMILVTGRYEGIDERVIDLEVDEQWSIGDYVLSGGELAAMVMIDAVSRFLPGVLGHKDSAQNDSFENGLLDYPQYTRPLDIDGLKVPEVLLSGNHEAVNRWRLKQSLGRTWLKRSDLIDNLVLTDDEKQLLSEYQHEFYQINKTNN